METTHNRWIINRIGLLNFWYYDEEEFGFSEGRLLLRGANGSGKSVTMQSFIPLLLDGNKSPERLDPFGSRARKLENYLLDEDDKDKEESTGYLYMEFCKAETGNFITVGMGLRAKRGKTPDFWGFSITDGRRIGKDIQLYKSVGEKIPLSKTEMKNRIGSGGEFYTTQSDYMDMVNRLLFGFESSDDYDELIKLLIQIRTPKLSKDFKPTVVYEIMNNSLQPLSDDDLRPMSESIESMDNIKSQLESLKESKAAADRLKNEYNRYNKFILLEKAREFTNSQDKLDAATADLSALIRDMDEFYNKYIAFEQEKADLKQKQEALQHKKEQLEQHDSFKAKQEIIKLENYLKDLNEHKSIKENSLKNKKESEIQLNKEFKLLQSDGELLESDIENQLEEMSELALGFYFYEHDFAKAEILKDISAEYDFKLLRAEIDKYKDKITTAKKSLQQENLQNQFYDRALKELEDSRREKENAQREMDKAGILLSESREEFIEKVYSWEKSNEYLKPASESMAMISRAAHMYGQGSSYDDIRMEISKCHGEKLDHFKEAILEVKALKADYEKQLKAVEEELKEWRSRKEPEPAADEKATANRQRLGKAGIPYIPLYKAIDFRDEVKGDIRGRIEEALMDMGLLNALIVPEKYKDMLMDMDVSMGDKYIFPNPRFYVYELSSFLKPAAPENSDITAEEIDNVLKSIMLDKNDGLTYLNESGEYSIGIINGKTTSCYTPKYIGIEARKKFKQENILRLEVEISELKGLIDIENQKLHEWNVKIAKLNSERDSFPGNADLETAYSIFVEAEHKLNSKIKDCETKEDYAEKAHHALKEIREKVRELTAKMQIALSYEAYEEAESDAMNYRDMLGILENQHVRLVQMFQRSENTQKQIDSVLQDMDDLLYDVSRLNRDIQNASARKKNYEDLLAELKYEEISAEIDECIKSLNEIPLKLEDAIKNAQDYKNRHEGSKEKCDKLKQDIDFLTRLNEICEEGFKNEYDLGYAAKYDDNEQSLLKTARRVCRDLKGEEKDGKLREDYTTALQERYHQNRQNFAEYNLIMEFIFDRLPEYVDDRLSKAASGRKRLKLSARIQGKDVDFYTLADFIEESIEENEKLLREKDRQLFEDILANTIGKKIRARIFHSEQWVKKMNALMESMNTSSGLSFSLVWKNRTAETEEQLDTKELVELLKSDASLLREEDMDRLSSHFRSKITQARKELEDQGSMQTFHSIMKEILDYRKWFEFQLFYRKTGENKKELTNNAFDKFSGGEKAMAMYVPLFSAVYARYDGARQDCPRIISLDEAFAGVDENNIRDMFRLLEELKLNFIINSQVLWGDYDTIPSLSICELIRPNNADFVTIIRYKWNGKIRSLAEDESDRLPVDEEAAPSIDK